MMPARQFVDFVYPHDSLGVAWELTGSLIPNSTGEFVTVSPAGGTIEFARVPDLRTAQLRSAMLINQVIPELTLVTQCGNVRMLDARLVSQSSQQAGAPNYEEEVWTISFAKIEFEGEG
jgi:hypothetical protein